MARWFRRKEDTAENAPAGIAMRLLLVEDDPLFGVILQGAFSKPPFLTEWVSDGTVAIQRASEQAYDAILLDIGLPGCNGLEVCRRLRQVQVDTPIVVVSGCADVAERVRALDYGADDFLVKPVEVPELLARVRAVTRRGRSRHLSGELRYGPLTMDPAVQTASVEGRRLDLTATEFRLLHCLLLRAGSVVTRQQIIQHVWAGMLPSRSNNPEVYVSYLRDKLAGSCDCEIRTVRGVGYVLTQRQA
jgi:DNA-binding response OmpR family regulator